jgi:limonene-1,2-epoxide hydrolase
MDFKAILAEFCAAVEAGDGQRLAALFTPDGVYHDVFYGAFKGHAKIAELLGVFHRDGSKFKWRMFDAVDDGATGYARWFFSYTAETAQAKGRRVTMEGVGFFKLKDGLIASYEDYAKTGESLIQLGLPPEKLHRVLAKMTAQQNAKPEAKEHLAA